MKVSVSIPEGDVASLDEYVRSHSMASRSAALQRAIRLLRANELSQHYAAAFTEWADDGEDSAWEAASGDGFGAH
ncbi:MAG: ribbon-helix-helix domain-containing protein [Acidimicrobiaceae bacterium]|nr:ribbon-helix-helix domain-containing protein [Acidimicrobiaceae bacterium]